MELHLGCRTCEFQKNGLCTNRNRTSEVGYLGRIDPSSVGMNCWSISLDYFTTLVSTLPLKDQKLIRLDERITVYELLERVETGVWNPKVLRRFEENEEQQPSLRYVQNYHAFV